MQRLSGILVSLPMKYYYKKMERYLADAKRYENGMQYERCGRSGVMLPKVSLGMWHNFGSVDPYERSREIVRYAFDHGVTHLDLANNYGPAPGSAEETLGRIMDDDLRPYRDELFISTKAGYGMWAGPYGDWGPNTPLEETLQTLVDVVRAGKSLYVGISNWPLEALRFGIEYLKRHDTPLLIYQGKLNMLHKAPIEEGILQLCHEAGVGFIAFSPLAQGLLTDRYLNGIPKDSRMSKGVFLREEMLTPELLAQLRQWNDEAQKKGESLAEKALAWILAQEGVTSVLVGASSTEQLARNLKVVR